MKRVLFISDLHLDASRPRITELFLDFLQDNAGNADALYILGDLFEAWVGDDDADPHHARVQDGMRALTDSGVAGYFMHGNRDFLVGHRFAERTGFNLLQDPSVIDLFQRPALLMHGDTLCTDDAGYQAFRRQVRDAAWQEKFLAQPLAARHAFAATARAESKAAQAGLAMDIMDVNREAVDAAFLEHGLALMIHGHTHRPGVHTFLLEGRPRQRIVLGDWYAQGSVLVATAAGLSLASLPLDE